MQVIKLCESRGVTIRVATEKLIAEEAPESYKDVSQVGVHAMPLYCTKQKSHFIPVGMSRFMLV